MNWFLPSFQNLYDFQCKNKMKFCNQQATNRKWVSMRPTMQSQHTACFFSNRGLMASFVVMWFLLEFVSIDSNVVVLVSQHLGVLRIIQRCSQNTHNQSTKYDYRFHFSCLISRFRSLCITEKVLIEINGIDWIYLLRLVLWLLDLLVLYSLFFEMCVNTLQS